MKALVLSGGAGTRLRPFTDHHPKQLIPVAGRPVLDYGIAEIARLGIDEVAVVVGEWGPAIADHLGDGSRFGVRLTYLSQERPLGLAHCVRLARPFLGREEFLLYLGDNVFADGLARPAAEFHRTAPAAQVVVRTVPDPRSYGVADVARDGTLRQLVEKPRQPPSDLAVLGAYFLGPQVHDAVDAIAPSARGELEITDAISELLGRGHHVTAVRYDGYWADTGTVADLLRCNRHLLDQLTGGLHGAVDRNSTVRPPVAVAPGARIVRSRVTGPAVVGPGALVVDSELGPYSAVGAGSSLRGVHAADTVVMAGTSPTPGSRLYGVLAGPGAADGVPGA